MLPTRSATKDGNDEVEHVIEVIGPLGCLSRIVVAGAVLWRGPLAEGVQPGGHLLYVGRLRLLDTPPRSSLRRSGPQQGQHWNVQLLRNLLGIAHTVYFIVINNIDFPAI